MQIIADLSKISKTVPLYSSCVIICNYAGTCKGIHVQLQSNLQLFDISFAIKKFSFCGALFKRILACHIVKAGVSKYVFTRDVIKVIIFHSCCTRVVRVALVPHSRCSCSTRVLLVLHSSRLCLALVL